MSKSALDSPSGADGIDCEGVIEGSVESDGEVRFGPQASWKGKSLMGRSLHIEEGAKLQGLIVVPHQSQE